MDWTGNNIISGNAKIFIQQAGWVAGEETDQGQTNHETKAEPEEGDDAQPGFRSTARR